jgi:hypothetical protein
VGHLSPSSAAAGQPTISSKEAASAAASVDHRIALSRYKSGIRHAVFASE